MGPCKNLVGGEWAEGVDAAPRWPAVDRSQLGRNLACVAEKAGGGPCGPGTCARELYATVKTGHLAP